MMRKLLYLLFTLLCLSAQAQKNTEQTVHLKGQLIDMGSNIVSMQYDDAAGFLGTSRDVQIKTDAKGFFDIVVPLKKPTYYSICRNTLYLTPGDNMTIKITQNNTEATFQGKGAEANNYMKYRLFPKGGSYLDAGQNLKKDFQSTKKTIDSLAAIRQQQLNALKNVSPEFKDLETARIKADVLNSYICYASYAGIARNAKNRQEAQEAIKSFYNSLTPLVQPLYKQLNKDNYLNVAVVRDVFGYLFDPTTAEWGKGITLSSRAKELYATDKYIGLLREKTTPELLDSVKTFMNTQKYADFKTELQDKANQVSKLLPGQPAFDFTLDDVNGQQHKLSDFKGKVIYIDLWATWCGPCIQESPHFEALSKEYQGKNIVFVPISTDTNRKAWLSFLKMHKKELTQYHTTDQVISKDWGVFYIPRFILIDKQFKIADAYAPLPSSGEEIKKALDKELSK